MQVRGHCPHCRCQCATIATVDDGCLVSVGPDREHPNGGICIVGASAPELVNHPQRLRQPMRRTRPKTDPDPGWQAITWDEALSETAERCLEIKQALGPEAVAFARGTPSATGSADYFGWVDRLCYAFGSPNSLGSTHMCQWARDFGSRHTYGGTFPWADYENAELIVLFGFNPAITWQTNWVRIREAQARGARLVVIDPKRSKSAKLADLHIAPRPGTDAVLCLGWIRELLQRQSFDKEFVHNWTNAPFLIDSTTHELLRGDGEFGPKGHFAVLTQAGKIHWTAAHEDPGNLPALQLDADCDVEGGRKLCTVFNALRKQVDRFTPERVAKITGVEEKAFLQAADWWAKIKPACYYSWNGIEQHSNNMQTNRALCTLYALTGGLEQKGGVRLSYQVPRSFAFGLEKLQPQTMAKRLGLDTRPLGSATFETQPYNAYTAMLTGEPYPIRALIGFGNNMLTQEMNARRGREALASLDFHVHMDMFETPTARMADIILPAASGWECGGLRVGYSGNSTAAMRRVQWRPASVAPPGESRSDVEVITELAQRLGLGSDFFDGDVDAAWRYILEGSGIDLDRLRETEAGVDLESVPAPRQYNQPDPQSTHKVLGFPTGSGRVELYAEGFYKQGKPPLASYQPPLTGDAENKREDYPLILGSARHRYYSNSQGRALPSLRSRRKSASLAMNPQTAIELGIREDQQVSVETPMGKLFLPLRIDPDLPGELVTTESGWWQECKPLDLPGADPFSEHGENFSFLTSEEWLDPVSGSGGVKTIPCRVTAV